jgi:hypothetical protein
VQQQVVTYFIVPGPVPDYYIILFRQMLNFSNKLNIYRKKKNILKENEESDGIFRNISFVDMKSSKLN